MKASRLISGEKVSFSASCRYFLELSPSIPWRRIMDSQELKAFTEFLKMADSANRRKPSFYETFQFKLANSLSIFALSMVGFKYLGDLLI